MAMSVTCTNSGGMLVHENRGGAETEYVPGTRGSVMMCRSATGTTTYTADYWPYGEVASSTGANPSAWGFCGTLGYYTDSVPGSLYVRARILLPKYGRWATKDPVWPYKHAYAYANGSPIAIVDPTGLAGTGFSPCGIDPKKSGPFELCKILCDDLVCAGAKGWFKPACVNACILSICDDFDKGNRGYMYNQCAKKKDADCDRCCDRVCSDLTGGLLGICLSHCKARCNPLGQ